MPQQAPVSQAFADESFHEVDGVGGFYVLAAALFKVTSFADAREAMKSLRGRRRSAKLHWNEMDELQQQTAAKAVADLDGFHVVTVGAPVPGKKQERARVRCLGQLVYELHGFGVELLVMESRTPALNRRDIRTVTGARYGLPKGTRFRIEHVKGAEEPLCWVADIVAGALRAQREGRPGLRELLDDCVYEIEVETGC